MRLITRFVGIVALVLASSFQGSLPAQVEDVAKGIPPFKLATKEDDKGLKQWDAFPHTNCPACLAKKVLKCSHCAHLENPEKCVECKKTRKAPCHLCAAKGALLDPLLHAPCPGCNGHKVLACVFCGNRGLIKLNTGGKRGQKCAVCKGHGGVPCTVCKGKRYVASPFKGKIGTQKLDKLNQARKTVAKLIKSVDKFRPVGKARVDRKAFKALFAKNQRDLPTLKSLVTFADTVIKKLDQPTIKDNNKHQVYQWDRIKHYTLFYLIHQGRVLDACIERAEFNAKAGKK